MFRTNSITIDDKTISGIGLCSDPSLAECLLRGCGAGNEDRRQIRLLSPGQRKHFCFFFVVLVFFFFFFLCSDLVAPRRGSVTLSRRLLLGEISGESSAGASPGVMFETISPSTRSKASRRWCPSERRGNGGSLLIGSPDFQTICSMVLTTSLPQDSAERTALAKRTTSNRLAANTTRWQRSQRQTRALIQAPAAASAALQVR